MIDNKEIELEQDEEESGERKHKMDRENYKLYHNII